MNMKAHLVQMLLTVLIICVSCAAQGAGAVESILPKLQAKHWTERAAALQQLTSIPGVLKRQDVREALIQLQETENRYIRTRDPSTIGDLPIDEAYEDEYTTRLTETLQSANTCQHDSRIISALAGSLYAPDSKFADWLADQKDALPRLLSMARTDTATASSNAIEVLARMIHKQKVRARVAQSTWMSDADQQQAISIIRTAEKLAITPAADAYMRSCTIAAAGLIAEPEDVDWLQAVAQSPSSIEEDDRDASAKRARKQLERIQASSNSAGDSK